MFRKTGLFAAVLIVSVIAGCKPAPKVELQYDRPLGLGEEALVKITDPALMPDFTLACMDLKDLKQAVNNSLDYLGKPSSQKYYPIYRISHQRTVDSLKKFAQLLDSGLYGTTLNQAIKDNFDVYMSVGCDRKGTVLFTGYYTPIFDGSLTQSEKYKYPLYKLPDDLVKDAEGKILGRKGPDGKIIDAQYPSRATLENTGILKGTELIWLTDPFEAYIAHVQGSAKIRLPDGKIIGVGYAANNGWDYVSVANALVADGIFDKSSLSLAAMIDYFKKHTNKVSEYTQKNPRFVFFKTEDGPPRGSLNEPVTPLRSIATDKTIFPRAALVFVSTYLPQERGGSIVQDVFTGFAFDQDTGGAILAPGRCDIYIGVGDEAGRLAGHTYKEGKFYYLFLKE